MDEFIDLIENIDKHRNQYEAKENRFPNIIYDMPMDDYLKHPAIGSTLLKKIISYNPAEFKAAQTAKNKETKSTALGTAIHTALLEPNEFFENYLLQTEDWGKRTAGEGRKKWDALKAQAKKENKKVLGYEELVLIQNVLNVSENHKSLRKILGAGRAEVTAIVDYGDYGLKARADWLTDSDYIWDVKSSSSGLSDDEIERTVFNMGYHFQLAHHIKVLSDAGRKIRGGGWIFISTQNDAVHIVVRRASDRLLQAGITDFEYAVSRLEKCLETDEWPGYDDRIVEIGLPFYAEKYYE